LNPDQGVVGDDNQTEVTGYFFTPNEPLRFLFDVTLMDGLSPIEWHADGSFTVRLRIPPPAGAGPHRITAEQAGDLSASATYTLIDPTVTNTPIPTNTWTPSPTPEPSLTPSTTPTSSPTPTFSPSPTLRPITPMVTITPIPPTARPPVQATSTPRPPVQATSTPRPTQTRTPPAGTPTNTLTPSTTPTPSDTPGPGTPAVKASPAPTPEEEMAETGGGWGTIFLWGFVLAGLLVVFRLLRVRGLGEQS
jgi:hypothetical protein